MDLKRKVNIFKDIYDIEINDAYYCIRPIKATRGSSIFAQRTSRNVDNDAMNVGTSTEKVFLKKLLHIVLT